MLLINRITRGLNIYIYIYMRVYAGLICENHLDIGIYLYIYYMYSYITLKKR